MTNSISLYVSELKKKLVLLLKNYNNLIIEKKSLQDKNHELNTQVLQLQTNIEKLKKNIEVVNIANSFDNNISSSSQIGRNRVNYLIREIDKCIALLNE